MANSRKRVYDGYMVPSADPVVFLMPYIMPRRTDSETFIDLDLDLSKVAPFIREHKKDIPGLNLYHIVFASLVRAASTVPEINRFICGNRLYQRENVRISMMIKKNMRIDGKETSIFPTFAPTDTLAEIVAHINHDADEALAELDGDSNDFDKLTGVLTRIPPFLLRGVVGFLMWMDRHGKLPKKLVDLQPFHSGFFVTNVGSIGLPVIFHHLYEFGTTSVFLAMGRKKTVNEVQADGSVVTKRYLPVKVVVDDRICDGFTYSRAFKVVARCFAHPEVLLEGFQPKDAAAEEAAEPEE